MRFTLEDSWTKLARGKERLATLATECDEYLSAGPAFTANVFYDLEAGAVEPSFSANPPPPPRIGTMVGDVVHNLRSALDVSAWQLAIANDEAAARKQRNLVTFSLTRTPEEFSKHRALPLFGESAHDVIERLQPYRNSMQALGWLRDLSNSDKHRIATFSFAGLAESPTGEVGVRRFSNLHMRFGTDEGHIGLTGIQAIVVAVEMALQEVEEGATKHQTRQ